MSAKFDGRLPEVKAAETVLIVEGEKDVETALRVGLPGPSWTATTSLGPAEWLSIYAESLRGKHVVICPDTDRRGQLYLRQIVRDLEGKVATLCWAKLPPGQKDLSAWVEQGATKEQVVELLRGAQPIDCQHLPDM
jgi:5S rRNA maturation endonuclease (ribonuclease M5)